ncbi:MAG: hypothetical protein M1813_002367 [Trichoglossum hirsutum]|nr:MAG: hypothetical protein M1813_002367 [Trichoglossum hirsutum]
MQEVMERRIDGVEPPEANLNWHRDLQGGRPTVVFDFDSLLVFPSSLAIAKRGVHYNPISPGTSELHTDVHISVRVNYIDHDGQQHQKQIPLFKFRIIVLDELSDGKILRRPFIQMQQWSDEVILLADHGDLPPSFTQRPPSSYEHSKYVSVAKSIEGRILGGKQEVAGTQMLR